MLDPEKIQAINDPKVLHEICLSLIKIRNKENASKTKYRTMAQQYQKQMEQMRKDNEMELSCLQEKNKSLQDIILNYTQNKESEASPKTDKPFKFEICTQSQIDILANSIDSCTNEHNDLVEELQKQIIELKQSISLNQENYFISNNEKDSKIILLKKQLDEQKDYQDIKEKYSTNMQEYTKLKSDYDSMQNNINELKNINKSQEEMINSLKNDVQRYKGDAELLKANIKGESESNKVVEEMRAMAEERIATLESDIATLTKSKEEELSHLRTLINSKDEELKMHSETNTNLQNQINAKSAELTDIQLEKAEIEKSLKTQIDQISKNLEEKNTEKSKIEENLKQLKDQYSKEQEQTNATIARLEEEKKVLIGIAENNKNKAKEMVRQMKLSLRDNIEQHNAEVAAVEEERRETAAEISDLREKLKAAQEDLAQMKIQAAADAETASVSARTIGELRAENSSLASVRRENEELLEELRAAKLELTTRETLLANETAAAERLQEVLRDKDAALAKMKEAVQHYSRAEAAANRTVDELRAEVCTLTKQFAEATAARGDGEESGAVMRLRAEKAELEEMLQSSQASADLVAKNRQLSAMMEKSNRLYTILLGENQKLAAAHEELKMRVRPPPVLSTASAVVATLKPRRQKASVDQAVTMAYLRRTLLQFFAEESAARAQMVPLILDLVGCTKEQIAVVSKQYERSISLVGKTTKFFFK